jgi:methanogen homocitrate synthase
MRELFTADELAALRRAYDAVRKPGTFEEGKWSVSHWNRNPDAQGKPFPSKVTVRDITVRTITQGPGVVVDGEQKARLAEALAEARVPSLQLSYLAHSADSFKPWIDSIKRINPGTEITMEGVHNREHIAMLADVGVDLLQLQGQSVPASVPLRRPEVFKMAWEGEDWRSRPDLNITTMPQLIATVQDQIAFAKSRGLRVSAGINQLSHSTPENLRAFCTAVAEAKPDCFTLYDSTSGMGPLAWRYVVEFVKKLVPGFPITVHTHNHFGLAVAGTLEAVQAGADVVEVAVNGVSDEAGQADLAETVVSLEVLYGVDTGIKMDHLTNLRKLVEDISGIKMAPIKPITGERVWMVTGEYLIWQQTVDPLYHLVMHPEVVGNVPKMSITEPAYNWATLTKLEALGMQVPLSAVPLIRDAAVRETRMRHRALEDDEFLEIAKHVLETQVEAVR